MTHFSEADWANVVRGIPIPNEGAMFAHLSGCSHCADLVAALRLVGNVHLRDVAQAPPAHAVHAARAIFSMWTPDQVRLFSAAAARLVFDSFANPVIAGIRSGHAMCRQLLYETPPYAIDLRLDQQKGERRVSLTGQVASFDSARRVGGIRVLLTSGVGTDVIQQIQTNEAGEFHLEYEPAPRLNLHVDVDSCPHIELPSDVRPSNTGQEFGRE